MVVLKTPEKRTLSQKCANNSYNRVEIVNTSLLDNQMDNNYKNTILRSNDSIQSNPTKLSFDHSHGSQVPSCLSTSDTTTNTIIHVPFNYDKSNDNFVQEIRV
jgi:hypothetical protein